MEEPNTSLGRPIRANPNGPRVVVRSQSEMLPVPSQANEIRTTLAGTTSTSFFEVFGNLDDARFELVVGMVQSLDPPAIGFWRLAAHFRREATEDQLAFLRDVWIESFGQNGNYPGWYGAWGKNKRCASYCSYYCRMLARGRHPDQIAGCSPRDAYGRHKITCRPTVAPRCDGADGELRPYRASWSNYGETDQTEALFHCGRVLNADLGLLINQPHRQATLAYAAYRTLPEADVEWGQGYPEQREVGSQSYLSPSYSDERSPTVESSTWEDPRSETWSRSISRSETSPLTYKEQLKRVQERIKNAKKK